MVSLNLRQTSVLVAAALLGGMLISAIPATASHCYETISQSNMEKCRARAEKTANLLLYNSQPYAYGVQTYATWTATDGQTTQRCVTGNALSPLFWPTCVDRFFLDKAGYNADRVVTNVYLAYYDFASYGIPHDAPPANPPMQKPIGPLVQCLYPSFQTSCVPAVP